MASGRIRSCVASRETSHASMASIDASGESDGFLDIIRSRMLGEGHRPREAADERLTARPVPRLAGSHTGYGKSRSAVARRLQLIHRRVAAAAGEELLVMALLDDLPLLEDEDPISHPHRREPEIGRASCRERV